MIVLLVHGITELTVFILIKAAEKIITTPAGA